MAPLSRRPSPAGDPITSSANPAIALVRSLQRRETRAQERAFVVEGRRAVADALAAGARPRLLLLRRDSDGALPPANLMAGVPVRLVAANVFDRLSQTESPQGILAVFPFPELTPAAVALPLALVLDRISDPGNLGTLLRTAAAAGVTAVYLTPGSVDPFNPKVVRAGMGAHFHVPIVPLDPAATAEILAGYPLRVLTDAEATQWYDRVDWRQPAAVLVGSEATGVGPEVTALATIRAAIPLAAGVESLNAAVAGAICLFEATRQRRSDQPTTSTGDPAAGEHG